MLEFMIGVIGGVIIMAVIVGGTMNDKD